MPRKNGIQVVTEVRELYKRKAEQGVILKEPFVVFLTAYFSRNFVYYLLTKDITEIYEKPLHDN